MSRQSNKAWIIGAVFLLGACGGSGASAPQPIPAPPAAPTAFPLGSSASFQATTVTQSKTAVPGANAVSAGAAALDAAGTISIDYDGASGTYTLRDPTGSATFAASDRTAASGFLDTYTKQAGTVTDQLQLLGNVRAGGPQAGAPLQLTYLSYGIWTHSDSQSGQVRRNYLLFGFPTATASMPRSGSANYQTAITGSVVQVGVFDNDVQLGGTAAFNVDFGTGAIRTALALTNSANTFSFGTFNGTGTLSGNQFSGSFTSSAPDFVGGSFNGGFFGPAANEMGYAFTIKKHNPDPFAGAAPAASDTFISGVVVGTKQ